MEVSISIMLDFVLWRGRSSCFDSRKDVRQLASPIAGLQMAQAWTNGISSRSTES